MNQFYSPLDGISNIFSMLWHYWLGERNGICPVKNLASAITNVVSGIIGRLNKKNENCSSSDSGNNSSGDICINGISNHVNRPNGGTKYTRKSAIADKPRDAFRGQWRSPNMLPFNMIGMVSYECPVVTLSERRTIFEIFDFENAVTLKTGLRVRECLLMFYNNYGSISCRFWDI